jgi:hypothetical protein
LAVKKDPIRDPASSAKGSEGAVVAVPDVVPQLVEGTAKYSRNCTASVRYRMQPGHGAYAANKQTQGKSEGLVATSREYQERRGGASLLVFLPTRRKMRLGSESGAIPHKIPSG